MRSFMLWREIGLLQEPKWKAEYDRRPIEIMRAEKRVDILEAGFSGAREYICKDLVITLAEELLQNGYITIRKKEDFVNRDLIISAEVNVVKP